MIFLTIFLILVIIGCLIGIYYIISFNKLNDLKTRIEEAESIIDENLRIKYDTLMRISNSLKKKMKEDKNISNFEMDRKLNEGLTLILKMQEDLDLNDNPDLNKDLETIKRLDEKLTAAKNYYNKNTSLENAIVRKFPTNLIAHIHHFKVKLFFDGKDMDDEIIDDFKM